MPASSSACSRRSTSPPLVATTPSTACRTIVGAERRANAFREIGARHAEPATQATARHQRQRGLRVEPGVREHGSREQSCSAWSSRPRGSAGSARAPRGSPRRPRPRPPSARCRRRLVGPRPTGRAATALTFGVVRAVSSPSAPARPARDGCTRDGHPALAGQDRRELHEVAPREGAVATPGQHGDSVGKGVVDHIATSYLSMRLWAGRSTPVPARQWAWIVLALEQRPALARGGHRPEERRLVVGGLATGMLATTCSSTTCLLPGRTFCSSTRVQPSTSTWSTRHCLPARPGATLARARVGVSAAGSSRRRPGRAARDHDGGLEQDHEPIVCRSAPDGQTVDRSDAAQALHECGHDAGELSAPGSRSS